MSMISMIIPCCNLEGKCASFVVKILSSYCKKNSNLMYECTVLGLSF